MQNPASNNQSDLNQTEVPHYYNLDVLRAISIVLVVMWHTQCFQAQVYEQHYYSIILYSIICIFNYNITLLAVPIFYLISIYLFFKKSDTFSYFIQRLVRLVILYIFWTSIQCIVYYISQYFLYNTIPSAPSISILIAGGPTVPGGGHGSVFYYLSDLIVLTIIAYVYRIISNDKVFIFISLLWTISFLIYYYLLHEDINPYWTIDNFLIYIPIVYLLYYYKNYFLKLRWFYLVIFIIFIVFDFKDATTETKSAYSRVSVVFGAITLFSFIFASKFSKYNKYIQFLSNYSLGIYALHAFVLFILSIIIKKLFGINIQELATNFLGVSLNMYSLLLGILTFVFTIMVVQIIAKSPLRKMIS